MIYEQTPRQLVYKASRTTVSWLNAIGTFSGLIAANIWDFLAGGFVVAGIFGAPIDLGGFTVNHILMGMLLSLALWSIQLLLWKFILEGGITAKDIPAIILAITIAIADTNGDTAAIYLWISGRGQILQTLSTYYVGMFSVTDIVVTSLTVAVYVLGGFGELFNALYFRVARYTPPTPAIKKYTARPKATNAPPPTYGPVPHSVFQNFGRPEPQPQVKTVPTATKVSAKPGSTLAELLSKDTRLGAQKK